MRIQEVIREYRKKQNLTQEQVANYLGVTAPAVNKWENGVTYPDITLLAPLARVLKTDVDTLLSFREELTDLEINQFIKEISAAISKEGYETAFDMVQEKIKEYPTCDKLILYTAQILNGYLAMGIEDVVDKEKYKKQIIAWFESVVGSGNQEISNMAIMSLSQNYISNGEFEEAQRLLDKIPPAGFDKRITQVNLYSKEGKLDKAYEVCEGMLYQNINSVLSSLIQIITILCKEEKYDKALQYAELAEVTGRSFDLGSYVSVSPKLEIYMKLKDAENTLATLEEMVDGLDTLHGVRNSKLYQHMQFKEEEGMQEVKGMLRRSLETDEELEFIRNKAKFNEILKKLS